MSNFELPIQANSFLYLIINHELNMILKKHLIFLVFLFLTSFSYGQSKEELVAQSFERYKNCILENRGADAAELVSIRTLDFYQSTIKHAIESDSSTVDNLPFFDKFNVLLIRHLFPKEEILKLDPKSFFKYASEQDLFGKESILKSHLGEVKINGKFATGPMLIGDKEMPLSFHFYEEEMMWKFDLVSLMRKSTTYITTFINSSEYTLNEYITETLFMSNGIQPRINIWDPIKGL